VLHIAVSVHEDDGAGAQSALESLPHFRAQSPFIQGHDGLTARADSFRRLDDLFVQQLRKHDAAVEKPGSRLGRNPQRVSKAAGDDQKRAFTLAFEQCVGGHRGPHLHARHELRGDRLCAIEPQQPPDPFHRGVRVLRWILRQQLVCVQPAVRRTAYDVGERAAPIDPELPARAHD
jgi:hypothetical protein